MIFVVGGVGLVLKSENLISIKNFESLDFLIGLVGILFFGLCFLFYFKKVFDRKYGLIINDNGIIDNSNGTSIGLIEWKDIISVEVIQTKVFIYNLGISVLSPKMLLIRTNNPQKYIKKSKNIISRTAMKENFSRYKTPLTIMSTSLTINSSKLEKLISEQIEKRKKYNL